MIRNPILFLALAFALFMAMPARARTWRVEKDGSGDYTIIQDAVNAAASGDTILIGPGRYNDKVYATSIGWSDSVRVLVTQDKLTIIGSGPQTIIGQDFPWSQDQGEQKGIVASDYWGNSSVHIEGIRFENMRDAIYIAYEFIGSDSASIKNCDFYQNLFSLFLIGDGGDMVIQDCSFSYMPGSARLVRASDFGNIAIRGCEFMLADYSPFTQSSLLIQGVQDGFVEQCRFNGGNGGIIVAYGGQTRIKQCVFVGQRYYAINPGSQSNVMVDSCTFRNQSDAITAATGTRRFVMTNSAIEDVTSSSFLVAFFDTLEVHQCDLAAGSRGTVFVVDGTSCSEVPRWDMTENYWGTTDPVVIGGLIQDYRDSDRKGAVVDFQPFLDMSTPTEKKSLGGIKAMFR